ncbi:3-isopropylmalate dehydrogenase [Seinonella peptonophila]|uniref:3-isopropylmalate dehydrogenase n=1 Tax=Seinonella peptonophila TaxID=112248 RepID=A0A1M4U7Z6_9BACL|nr:3-isopropylmalate dehydrogenase [Seinonella peptonophila]SHE52717.1 3-isopropylmalate dehydrogenase [Seinonella peptonophila]
MKTTYQIALIPGDGIGPEIVAEAVKVLKQIERTESVQFEFSEVYAGGIAIDKFGEPLPDNTLTTARLADAVLLGAVGGPKWDQNPSHLRPEKALLGLRKELGLYSNLRPVTLISGMEARSTLKAEVLSGVDLIVVRELTGGIYFGEKKREKTAQGEFASDLLIYHEHEIERIVHQAFSIAQNRKKHLTSVDKANVLESSRFWREIVERIAPEYPDVQVNHMLVDNCAMQLLLRPSSFDVIVTENMFGDILSDEAAMLTGSIGLLPSASLGEGTKGMYEPVHGSAPDIAGKGIANPAATILSAALLLRHSLGMETAAQKIESAVQKVLSQVRTADLAAENEESVSTQEFGDRVVAALSK